MLKVKSLHIGSSIFFKGSTIEALPTPPLPSLMAAGTLPSEKKLNKKLIFSLIARPLTNNEQKITRKQTADSVLFRRFRQTGREIV